MAANAGIPMIRNHLSFKMLLFSAKVREPLAIFGIFPAHPYETLTEMKSAKVVAITIFAVLFDEDEST
jgi:L-cystine uptake protein TcyP (sodium:dicarboxylate symporter family)